MKRFIASATVVVSCWIVTSAAVATDLLVPSQYGTIQAAINAAVDGDTVIVAPGTYNQTMSVSGKSITIRSSDGPITTKIDRVDASGTIFNISGGADKTVTIEGFTITRWAGDSYIVTSDAPKVVMRNDRCLMGGFGVRLTGGADLTVVDNDWVLMGNTSYSDRSPIRANGGCLVAIANSSFQGMLGYYGGLAYLTTDDSFSLTDSRVIGCRSQSHGGCVYSGSNANITIAESTFDNCRTDSYAGGVVYQNSGALTIADSSFRALYSGQVGALAYCESGPVLIQRSTVQDSSTSGADGGSYAGGYIRVGTSPLVIEDCTFRNLHTTHYYLWGGIIGTRSGGGQPIQITRTRFEDCSSNTSDSSSRGRVISSYQRALTVQDCQFIRSTSTYQAAVWPYYGGSIHVEGGTFAISGCTFDRQSARQRGGAIYAESNATGAVSDSSFVRCGTEGQGGYGAIWFEVNDTSTWQIDNCHFLGSSLYNNGNRNLRASNCTFVRDPAFGVGAVASPYGQASFYDCLFKNDGGGYSLNMGSGGYSILSGCAFCRSPAEEIYQYYIEKEPCVFNADCDSDCDADGLPDDYEIAAGFESDCNSNGTPDSCDFPSGGSADCDGNGTFDVCDIVGGAPDCNLNGVLDSCEPDCDNDATPDSCEIAGGASDCNANGVPDTCEADCDGDGTLDVCEITSGAGDCDADGIPDSCQISAQPMLDLNNDAVLDSCQPSMQFAGLRLEIVPIVGRGTDDTFPVGAVCYRLFATTTNDATRVFAVYGNPANAMTVAATGGFWQSPYGADIATDVPCNLSAAPPTANYDSWFTIGLDCAFGNASQNANLNLTAFNRGGGVNDNDGAIYVVPDALQALAGSSKQVLLAQLTTTQATFPMGYVNVIGRAANSTAEWIASHQQIPAPILVDCNGNGDHDAFDIALGTALDCDESGVPDSCEFPSAITDCNGNGLSDLCDTVSGFSSDVNGNHIPDECECAGDVDGNGYTNVDDLLEILVAWGDGSYGPADLNQDGTVGSADLAIVLGGWGGCL